jgi:hypothetical protein
MSQVVVDIRCISEIQHRTNRLLPRISPVSLSRRLVEQSGGKEQDGATSRSLNSDEQQTADATGGGAANPATMAPCGGRWICWLLLPAAVPLRGRGKEAARPGERPMGRGALCLCGCVGLSKSFGCCGQRTVWFRWAVKEFLLLALKSFRFVRSSPLWIGIIL